MKHITRLGILGLTAGLLTSCNPAPSQADLDGTRGGRLDVYFNEPGTRAENMWQPDAIDVMVDLIDSADASIDFAVMGFTHQGVISAFLRAHDRGVKVRMVGDAGHLYNTGYQQLMERHVPMVTGNTNHIMHNKFMVVDDRFVFGSTANWSNTDLIHNSNNFFIIDHPLVADDFQAEFQQMFDGAFGHTKVELFNGRSYEVGDSRVEVWFSPNEDALGRILELIDGAKESVRFTIFAFTKDQVGSAFIRHIDRMKDEGKFTSDVDPLDPAYRGISGVIDRSQLHSNGQYHEVFRLLGADADLRMDGNDNSQQPGDYQAGGGRLHSKTMIIDAYGENPVVISGSFNWSSSATVSNDEYMLVMHGPRVAQAYMEYYKHLWDNGKRMGADWIGEDGIEPGDIVINEIQWYGVNALDIDGNDEFIELRNTTDRDIKLDLWQVANPDDFVLGFPPGAIIQANSTYLVLDHQLEAYVDGAPQDEYTAYTNGDLVVNAYNDNRQARLYIKDGQMELFLKDPDNQIMDYAGDGGPAFAGGPSGSKVYSMERLTPPGDGRAETSWKSCSLTEGGANVNEPFRNTIIATPGEPNSP
ncbi:MAG: lamin tail domain-containing protein [Alphaproteobacteria bacterium]|nr:lamin tail domain-containing protein [Alphaproteobacteria bacterium]